MAEFKSTVLQQNDIFYRINRTVENLKKRGKDNLTRQHLDTTLELLDSKWRKFADAHSVLLGKRTKELDSHKYFQDDLYDQCETAYIDVKAEVLRMRDRAASPCALNTSLGNDTSRLVSSTARSHPKITLPKFSGDYQSWTSFRDLFQSMVGSNDDIPAVEKFHHLKSSLTGDAARHIANVPVTADNFGPAWDALVARYENKRAIVSAHLDKFFAIAPIARKSVSDLKGLVSTVKEALGGLGALGAPIDSWDFILVHFITRRLDPETREAWELRQGTATDPATFRELDDFLDGRIRALEVIAPGNSSKNVKAAKTLATKPASRVNAVNAYSFKCSFCDGSHFITSCNEFAAKPTEDRREFVVSKRLCANCLGNHRLIECKSAKRCRLCGGHHHTLIHRASATSSAALQPGQSAASEASSSAAAFAVATGSGAISLHASGCRLDAPAMTLLPTARVRVLNRSGQAIEARALLDLGAELSLVRESFAQLLRCPRHRASIPLLGVGSLPSYTTRGALALRLQSCVDPTFEFDAAAYVVPRVMSRAPGEEVDPTAWSHLGNLPLADPT
ncbi:uncharacterized protein LOC113005488 [Solenopsis invicta]|uniref:uncharacterized protein LOC113005488 n=1 Tax=Solenopsis invicta TaxID=13686 RepID=UPI000E33DE3D|nr:uncharacterized protein LOC113005488 [Solenopsis invicta]